MAPSPSPGRERTRSRLLVAIGGLVLAAVVGVGALVGYQRFVADDGPLRGNRQDPAPALAAPDDPAQGELVIAAADGIVTGPSIEVLVTAPPGATEMQIGLDPSFSATPWQPVAASVAVPATDTGYQMVVGRFRSGPGAPPSPTSIVGATVDPTFDAATASSDGRHRISWVRPIGPDAIVVRIEEGRIERGTVVRYDFDDPPAGDDVGGLLGPRTVRRDGADIGRQVDGADDLLKVFDRLDGRPIDGSALDGGAWTLTEGDDDAGAAGVAPIERRRLSRAAGIGVGPGGELLTPLVHDVILRFDEPIAVDRDYILAPPADLVEPIAFSVDADATISPAVHVNQNGYAPADRLKVGYLADYPGELAGSGGFYRSGLVFRVIEVGTGRTVFEGQTTARPPDDGLGLGDLTGAPVYELDFSPVTETGRYQACVVDVGCSEPFDIADRVWDELVVATARAMYHQRSGVALGPPYTAIARPRPYHPDDGLVVTESDLRLLDAAAISLDEAFAQLTAQRTETVVPAAWGGHFDAGDWDRRIEHLYYVRTVVDLIDRHPDRFAGLDLLVPESGDAVPDLLDEGLWTLDLFHRLQRPDGAIPGGIEASEHPQPDTTSWTDTLAVFTYEPDPFATYLYAGVAAQTAEVLAAYDPDRASRYLESALAAMAWAEAQPPEAGAAEVVEAHRSVAAVALYGATGDPGWHDLFLATTTLDDGVDGFLSCHERTRCDAGWRYLGLPEAETDPELRALIEQSFVATADEIVAAADGTAFGWALENRFVPLIWGLGVGGAPKATGLLRAYEITGDPRYLEAAQRTAAVSLGANPTNTVYVTGVGRNPVRHPLIVDTLNGGLPVWPGTPVYGNHALETVEDDAWVEDVVLAPAGVDPLPTELPYLWQWADVPDVAMFNEYTIFQSHAQALAVYASLAVASGEPTG